MNTLQFLSPLLLCSIIASVAVSEEVEKPTGTYASQITPRAVQNRHMQGGLVRVTWSEIEPKPGEFDFTSIERQVRMLKPEMNWTLAIHGGWTSMEERIDAPRGWRRPLMLSPDWLVSDLQIKTYEISFRGNPVQMPRYWDPAVQSRLKKMLQAVGKQYAANKRLKLVYVPQMTSNGIEGHFNGVSTEALLQAAGIDPSNEDAEIEFGDLWVSASAETARSVLEAFPDKAVAFELHELFHSTAIPARIIAEFQKPEYQNRVGIGMWWISGKTEYQERLIALLKQYDGDLYGQIIGRSNQSHRFPNGDYTAVFQQAEELGMRYIEPWNYEFENHTYDETLKQFNASSKEKYAK